LRKAEIFLEYQNYIDDIPITPAQQFQQAASSDGVTIDTWRDIWIGNTKANHAKYGPFKDKSAGSFHGLHKLKPGIIVGSGPSLKHNAHELLKKGDIPVISCLHNFHFLEDLGVQVDYYVTLDAGPVVIEEVSEGGKKSANEYFEMSKNKKLIAFIGTDPKLLEKWQGEVYFFHAPIPDPQIQMEIDACEKFRTYISNGGNVLGACLYFAKGILGCNPIAFMGADFCFSYDKKFHAWNSKYDAKLGHVMKLVDVFGNKVLSWQSYFNFKVWFEYVARTVPGIYINCTEGGAFGSYAEGNIRAVQQMELAKFLDMYHMCDTIKDVCLNPDLDQKKLLF
jgi:hypothetical protein